MKQEMEITNLSNLNISPEFSFPNDILTGQLSNAEKIYFESHAVAEDNDCGFHALGLERNKAVTQLLAHAKNEKIRRLVASEIQAAFLEGTLPKEMQDKEYQSLWQAYNVAWENYRQTIVEVKEEIRRSNEDYFSAIQLLTPDVLITWFDKFPEYSLLKERLLKVRSDSVFPIERKLDIYCEKEETFKAFITCYLGKEGWLTYIGNYQNKTQQTSSLDALAELNHIQVFIWQGNSSNSQQLQLVHQYGKLEYSAIHMLHTHGMTHYDLLQQIEKPILGMTAPQTIPPGKQEENQHLLSSFISETDNNSRLSFQMQLPPKVKKIVEEIEKSQEKMNYPAHAEAFIKLGEYYLEQSEYLYAAAIYNYVLNVYRLKQVKHETTKELNPSPEKNKAEQKILERLASLEEQFIFELRTQLQKSAINNPHLYLQTNLKHCDYLQRLRHDCKQQLAKIDEQYSFDIYDEEKAKGEEEKYQQLQLAKAEAVRELYHDIAERLKAFVQQLIQECIDVLDKPPCDYAVIGLGSLAREEATPYSDLEFAILIVEEKEDYKQYFRNLTKLLHLKVINLGETILPAMGIPALNNYYSKDPLENWFYDEVTPRGFAFDGAMPQASKTPLGRRDKKDNIIFELIGKPEGIASYHKEYNSIDADSLDSKNHLSVTLLNPIFIIGSLKLLETYNANTLSILNDINNSTLQPYRLTLARQELLANMDEFHPKLTGMLEEGKFFVVKKEVYRLVDRIIDGLGIYYLDNYEEKATIIEYKSAWIKIEKLFKQGIFNECAKNNLKIVISIATELRLRTYLQNNRQNEGLELFTIPASEIDIQERISQLFYLPRKDTANLLSRYYFTALPLHQAVEELLLNDSNFSNDSLKGNDFLDHSPWKRAQIAMRLFEYAKVINQLKPLLDKLLIDFQIGTIVDGLKIFDLSEMLSLLANAYEKLGKYRDQEYYLRECVKLLKPEKIRIILKNKADTNIISKVTNIILNNIAVYHHNLGSCLLAQAKYTDAEEFFQIALKKYKHLYSSDDYQLCIAQTLQDLGAVFLQQDARIPSVINRNKAKDYLFQAVDIYAHLKAEPEVAISKAICIAKLGLVLLFEGKYLDAKIRLKDAIRSFKTTVGKSHPLTLDPRNSLAVVYGEMGNYEKQEKNYRKLVKILPDIHKTKNHPDYAQVLGNLGDCLIRLNKYQEAKAVLYEAKDICTLGDTHPITRGITMNLLRAIVRQENSIILKNPWLLKKFTSFDAYTTSTEHSGEFKYYQEAIKIYDSFLAKDNIRGCLLISLFKCCGKSAYDNRAFSEAIEHYQVATLLFPTNIELSDRLKQLQQEQSLLTTKQNLPYSKDKLSNKNISKARENSEAQTKTYKFDSQSSLKQGFFNKKTSAFKQYYDEHPITEQQSLIVLNQEILPLLIKDQSFVGYFRQKGKYILDAVLKVIPKSNELEQIEACLNQFSIPNQEAIYNDVHYLVIPDINGETAALIKAAYEKLQQNRSISFSNVMQ